MPRNVTLRARASDALGSTAEQDVTITFADALPGVTFSRAALLRGTHGNCAAAVFTGPRRLVLANQEGVRACQVIDTTDPESPQVVDGFNSGMFQWQVDLAGDVLVMRPSRDAYLQRLRPDGTGRLWFANTLGRGHSIATDGELVAAPVEHANVAQLGRVQFFAAADGAAIPSMTWTAPEHWPEKTTYGTRFDSGQLYVGVSGRGLYRLERAGAGWTLSGRHTAAGSNFAVRGTRLYVGWSGRLQAFEWAPGATAPALLGEWLGPTVRGFPTAVGHMQVSPDGTRLAVITKHVRTDGLEVRDAPRSVRIFDITGATPVLLSSADYQTGPVWPDPYFATWSPDQQQVVVSYWTIGPTVYLWDGSTIRRAGSTSFSGIVGTAGETADAWWHRSGTVAALWSKEIATVQELDPAALGGQRQRSLVVADRIIEQGRWVEWIAETEANDRPTLWTPRTLRWWMAPTPADPRLILLATHNSATKWWDGRRVDQAGRVYALGATESGVRSFEVLDIAGGVISTAAAAASHAAGSYNPFRAIAVWGNYAFALRLRAGKDFCIAGWRCFDISNLANAAAPLPLVYARDWFTDPSQGYWENGTMAGAATFGDYVYFAAGQGGLRVIHAPTGVELPPLFEGEVTAVSVDVDQARGLLVLSHYWMVPGKNRTQGAWVFDVGANPSAPPLRGQYPAPPGNGNPSWTARWQRGRLVFSPLMQSELIDVT